MPRSTPAISSSVDGPPGAGCSDTFAIRCTGMWPGESAYAQPLERPRPISCAIRRSVWYPTRTPSFTMFQVWVCTPSSSYPMLARPCSTVRSPTTFITGEPYRRAPSLSKVANEVPAYAASYPSARSSSVACPIDSWMVSHRLVGSITRSYRPLCTEGAFIFSASHSGTRDSSVSQSQVPPVRYSQPRPTGGAQVGRGWEYLTGGTWDWRSEEHT